MKIMKKYIDAELQIVRMNNNDIVTNSPMSIVNTSHDGVVGDAPDRFRDFEDYSY